MHFLSPPPQQSSCSSRNPVQAPFWAGNEADSKKRGLEAKSWKQKAHCLAPRITDPTSFSPLPTILAFSSDSLKKTRNELCVSPLLSREFFANFFEVAPPILPECPHAKGPSWGLACRRKTDQPENKSLRPQRNNAFDLRLCF